MCGIAGWLDSKIDLYDKRDILTQMSLTLSKRGPDEHGEYIKKNVALLHRRLAVIDIENGKQPMSFSYKNETYTIVYNGELYNAEELRDDLISKGIEFSSHCDTEVLLKCYAYYKKECVNMLNGIYAFAVFEEKSKTLFLCRDRIGVKPLFYYEYDNGLLFASEIKAMLKSKVFTPAVDENGLYEIFFLGPARSPSFGIYKGVKELLPGEYAIYKNGSLFKEQYYKLTAKEHTDSEFETIDKTRFLLQDAIKRQLVSDVPMCFFLSGGLDSSIICKTAADYYKKHDKGQIYTYSVEYRDNKKYFQKSLFQPNADYEYISLMVDNTKSNHTEIILDNEQVANALYDSVKARDLPGYVDIDSSLLLFCKEIKKKNTVALSGECADELFGGYPWYHNKNILFEQCFPWSKSQEIRRKILKDGFLPKGEEYVMQKYYDTINSADKLPSDSPVDSRYREMFLLNFYWFMQCLLERKDRCSMYSSLEVRVPFCDYRLVDYAYNMPWRYKSYQGREKGIIRKAFDNILPYDICWRKKSPYPKTHNPIYMKICSDKVKQILDDKTSPLYPILDKNGIMDIIENPQNISSPWYGQLMKAPQIMAYIIEVEYWLKEYGVVIEC
ncbi:MAG: asparagine synthase (glutamine-hydrolyzing) [Oscillospiraceae bacterium]|nr:asparagine synthase (glutamine-hydrolyzing) [Candidatus Ruminococcus equi]